jgi:hypothetical protein
LKMKIIKKSSFHKFSDRITVVVKIKVFDRDHL